MAEKSTKKFLLLAIVCSLAALTGFAANEGAFAVSGSVAYEYDELGRLKKVTHDVTGPTEDYQYDAAGNRQTVTVAGVTAAGDHGIKFDRFDDALMVPNFSGFPSSAITFEVEFATKDQGFFVALLSYAVPSQATEVVVASWASLAGDGNPIGLIAGIRGSGWVGFGHGLHFDGQRHRLTVTWRESDGETKYYLDGVLFDTVFTSPGAPLIDNGTLVIGQEQDIVGGGFEAGDAYAGEIYHVKIWNTELGASEISAGVATDPNARVADFEFTEGSGTSTTSSVGGYVAQFLGDPEWVADDGVSGVGPDEFGIAFEGRIGGDGLIVSNFSNFPTTDFTMEVIYESTDPKSGSALISYAVSGQSNEVLIWKRSDGMEVRVKNVLKKVLGNFFDGKRHRLTITRKWSNGDISFYLDGVFLATMSNPDNYTIVNNGTLTIGQEQDSVGGGFSADQAFEGEVYKVKIWNQVLSGSEIAAGAPVVGALVADFDLNEGTGTAAADGAGSHMASFLGAPRWIPDDGAIDEGAGGYGLAFDGTLDGVLVSGFSGFPSDAITVEFLMESTDHSSFSTLFSYAVPSEIFEFLVMSMNPPSSLAGMTAFVHDFGWYSNTYHDLFDGRRHRLTITWRASDGETNHYLDGVLMAKRFTSQGAPLITGGSAAIALYQTVVGGGFAQAGSYRGEIHHLKMWDAALTPSEVAAGVATDPNTRLADFAFDEGSGTSAASSIGGYTAQFVNSPKWVSQ